VNQYSKVIEATPSLRDRISVRLCLSKALETSAASGCSAGEAATFWLGLQVALNKFGAKDLAAELGAPTQFGRPNWRKELGAHARELLGRSPRPSCTGPAGELEVDVYACGNAMLVASLEEACDDLCGGEATFRLFAEEF